MTLKYRIRKKANSKSQIREIADKKTPYNKDCGNFALSTELVYLLDSLLGLSNESAVSALLNFINTFVYFESTNILSASSLLKAQHIPASVGTWLTKMEPLSSSSN